MSNKNNVTELNLKEFVNSLSVSNKSKDFFDLTANVILEETPNRQAPAYGPGARLRPGYKLSRDGEIKDKSYYEELIDFAADEFIPKSKKAVQRLTSSLWREADKDLARDSNSIKQGVDNIRGNDINLLFLRKYFTMYSKVCYRSLTATEGQNFQRPVYTDPGIYCIDDSIDKTVRFWT